MAPDPRCVCQMPGLRRVSRTSTLDCLPALRFDMTAPWTSRLSLFMFTGTLPFFRSASEVNREILLLVKISQLQDLTRCYFQENLRDFLTILDLKNVVVICRSAHEHPLGAQQCIANPFKANFPFFLPKKKPLHCNAPGLFANQLT